MTSHYRRGRMRLLEGLVGAFFRRPEDSLMERLQHRHLILFFLFVMLLLLIYAPLLSCHESQDDDSDDDDNDNDGDDDDNDTTMDDDTTLDDDIIDDDDATPTDVGPILSDAYFQPNPAELREYNDEEMWWYTALYLEVCDPDNDLLPGGLVWTKVLDAVLPPTEPYLWSDFIPVYGGDLADAGDCEHPVTAYIDFWLGEDNEYTLFGEFCLAVWAVDDAEHFSDTLEPVCFELVPSTLGKFQFLAPWLLTPGP